MADEGGGAAGGVDGDDCHRAEEAAEDGAFAGGLAGDGDDADAREILDGASAFEGGEFAAERFSERFGGVRNTVLLFGAGHVGRAIVLALSQLPFSVRWIDSRTDHFPPYVPSNVITVRNDEPEREIDAAPPGAFVLIMTHSHPLDYSIAASALRRSDFGFVGLIGSITKRARFASQARQLGISEDRIARLVCPIGLPDIRDKEPSVIAAGVAAQLLIARERMKQEKS